MTPVRIGIIGCGRIVRLAHLRSLQEDHGVQVVALADVNSDNRAWAASRVPGARAFESPEALFDGVELNAVVIAVPASEHRAVAEQAFARGLHVYLEKPVATNITDAESIATAWRKAGTAGRIGFNCRFNALYRTMREQIARGDIGDPVAVRTALTARWPEDATWRVSPTHGGGGLLELASHHVDLLRFLFGGEVEVTAASTWSNRGVDEAAMLQLRLSSGLRVQTLVSYGTVEEDRFEVYGTTGKLIIDRYNSLVVERTPPVAAGGIGTAVRRAVAEVSALPYGLRKRRAPGQEPSFAASLGDFIETVKTGRAASPSIDDGVASLRVIAAARVLANGSRQ